MGSSRISIASGSGCFVSCKAYRFDLGFRRPGLLLLISLGSMAMSTLPIYVVVKLALQILQKHSHNLSSKGRSS